MAYATHTVLALLLGSGCGARVSPAMDVAAVVRKLGAKGAHRELVARAHAEPTNVQVRLARAELAEQLGRPSEAIDELIAVERIGGPFGTRWRASDRARLARLLAQRGRVRLMRHSNHAIEDFLRARELGAVVSTTDIAAARAAWALAALRHVDADERAKGRAALGRMADPHNPAWTGARGNASPSDRAEFGVWAWNHGARREAYDQLTAWHTTSTRSTDARYETYYQCARAWWDPVPARDSDAAHPGEAGIGDLLTCPPSSADAGAGQAGTIAYAGDDARADAAARFARGKAIAIVEGNQAPRLQPLSDEKFATAGVIELRDLGAMARAYRRSPSDAESAGMDIVARSADAALARATLGALFEALGDPARARAQWDIASSASNEAAIVAGFAEACAHAGDGDAALVAATGAAAAWGDPAVVWNGVGRALLDSGRMVEALTAARAAIDLASPQTLTPALDVAIEASRQLGRTAQAEALTARRTIREPQSGDDAAAAAMCDDLARDHTDEALGRAWLATRRDVRAVELRIALVAALAQDDPRQAVVVAELIELSGDRDPTRGLRAARSFR